MAAVRTPPAKTRARKVGVKVVVPETREAAVARALANLNAAETRNGRPAPSPVTESRRRAEERKQEALNQALEEAKATAPGKRITAKEQKAIDQAAFNLDSALGEIKTEHLQCRDYRHTWQPRGAFEITNQGQHYYEQILRCGRCGTDRVRHIGMRGQLLGSHYDYPDGYVMKGAGRFTSEMNDSLRLASIRSDLRR